MPRSVVIAGQQFVNASTSLPFVMSGPNVVVKASPYLPSVEGAEVCNDVVNDECAASMDELARNRLQTPARTSTSWPRSR